jgi:hypothetical protein
MLHAHRTIRVTSDCGALQRMMRAAISRVGPRVAHSYNHVANYTAGRLWGQGKTPLMRGFRLLEQSERQV